MQANYDVAILGAGPIGLEAALCAANLGHRTVLIERDGPAQNVLDWGHVRMFSSFGMNSSPRGRAAVGERPDADLPADDDLLSGHVFTEDYLLPLWQACKARDVATVIDTVVEVRRAGWPKTAGIGDTARGQSPFEIFLQEQILTAKHVLDCTGTFRNHTSTEWRYCPDTAFPVVPPQRGERELCWGPLPPPSVRSLSGHRVLVVGSGYTAATDVRALHAAKANVTWLTRRSSDRPVTQIPDDPLPERQSLAAQVNDLAALQKVDWRPAHRLVEACPVHMPDSSQRWAVTAIDDTGEEICWDEEDCFDAVVLDTGFRPDTSLFRELHVHLCYATEGPMKLAASLLGETDCLNASGSDASLLSNPEPGFFILGSKSYGRNSNFLLRAGIEQIETVFAELIPAPASRGRESPELS